jgi:hypothetical protein
VARPSIVDSTEGTQTSDSTSWTATYPTCNENELLLLIVATSAVPTPSISSTGWTVLASFGKRIVPAGGLSGTFTVTVSQAEQGCWKVLRIVDWQGALGVNFTNSDPSGGAAPLAGIQDATGTAPNPPAMNPFNWDASKEETLWVPCCCADGGDTTFSAIPANYATVGTNLSSGGATGAALSVVSRNAFVFSEDVGAWTLSASVVYRTVVIAVRSAAVFTPGLFAYPATHFGAF